MEWFKWFLVVWFAMEAGFWVARAGGYKPELVEGTICLGGVVFYILLVIGILAWL